MIKLIAEISAMHGGKVDYAKQLIIAAKDAGADAVKSQAFLADDMAKIGSMPLGFYQQCFLSFEQCLELIAFGNENNIPIFFTILSDTHKRLANWQRFQKIYAKQFAQMVPSEIAKCDHHNYIISMNECFSIPISKANILYATDYCAPIEAHKYLDLVEFYQRPIGISHHNTNILDLLEAINTYDVPIVEKHFFLENLSYDGITYRDCHHAVGPALFKEIAKSLGK